jgi:two-component system KDP operon response regulator KdpE
MSLAPRILVIDEDPAIRRYLRRVLREAAYRGTGLAPGCAALERLARDMPDLVLLDLDGQAARGVDAIKQLRAISSAPIVALSVRSDENSVSAAIENGADDYLVKPFGKRELLARLHGALRRALRARGVQPLVSAGDLVVDLVHRRVWSRGREMHLPAKPYEVLSLLIEGAGRVLRHEELLTTVWGAQRSRRRDYLRLAIRQLRRLLEPDPAHPVHILTEHRVGYRFQVQAPPIEGTMRNRTPPSKRRA